MLYDKGHPIWGSDCFGIKGLHSVQERHSFALSHSCVFVNISKDCKVYFKKRKVDTVFVVQERYSAVLIFFTGFPV